MVVILIPMGKLLKFLTPQAPSGSARAVTERLFNRHGSRSPSRNQPQGQRGASVAESDPRGLIAVARLIVAAVDRHADRVLEYFAGMYRAMPDFSLTAAQLASSGTTVFVRWRMTGTFNGAAWNGIEPNGASIDLCGIDCMTFANGRLQHNCVAYDSYTFASQAGAI